MYTYFNFLEKADCGGALLHVGCMYCLETKIRTNITNYWKKYTLRKNNFERKKSFTSFNDKFCFITYVGCMITCMYCQETKTRKIYFEDK